MRRSSTTAPAVVTVSPSTVLVGVHPAGRPALVSVGKPPLAGGELFGVGVGVVALDVAVLGDDVPKPPASMVTAMATATTTTPAAPATAQRAGFENRVTRP
jgi:hypothetical protein